MSPAYLCEISDRLACEAEIAINTRMREIDEKVYANSLILDGKGITRIDLAYDKMPPFSPLVCTDDIEFRGGNNVRPRSIPESDKTLEGHWTYNYKQNHVNICERRF